MRNILSTKHFLGIKPQRKEKQGKTQNSRERKIIFTFLLSEPEHVTHGGDDVEEVPRECCVLDPPVAELMAPAVGCYISEGEELDGVHLQP